MAYCMRFACQAVGDPNLDQSLTCDAKVGRLPVKGIDHLSREVDIDTSGFQVGTFRFGHVGKGHYTAAVVKMFFKFLHLHRFSGGIRLS